MFVPAKDSDRLCAGVGEHIVDGGGVFVCLLIFLTLQGS